MHWKSKQRLVIPQYPLIAYFKWRCLQILVLSIFYLSADAQEIHVKIWTSYGKTVLSENYRCSILMFVSIYFLASLLIQHSLKTAGNTQKCVKQVNTIVQGFIQFVGEITIVVWMKKPRVRKGKYFGIVFYSISIKTN